MFATLAVLGLPLALSAEPQGRWELTQGSGPGVADYTGQLVITERGSSFLLRWETTEGEFSGVGMPLGRRLVAGWGTGRGYGLGVLEIRRDGSLEGRWTEPAAFGMQGREQWVPAEEFSGLEGTYTVRGRLPALAGEYQGVVEIVESDGDTRLTWHVLGETYEGIGVKRGRTLIVAWGPTQGAGLAVYRLGRHRGRGRWIRVDGVGWGAERLRR